MGNYTISPRKVKHTMGKMGTSHKKTSSKNTRIFTFIIIIALKGKTMATNLSKAINTRLRVQTTCESALRYFLICKQSKRYSVRLIETVGVNIPSLTYSSQLNNIPRRSEKAMFTM